ncbi:di-heme-cytochrome C peroxidase [Bdellovibrio sp. HCB2-146]|uniref:di-heme-cytochrome C peroxidase n=1 Tax=Bdellovibrio sp. HCB2-146 TaxID=3394362 RepID=UPI0039BD17AF
MKMKLALLSGIVLAGAVSCTSAKRESDVRGPSSQGPVYERPEGLRGADLADFEHLAEGADVYPYDWIKALNSIGFKDKNGNPTQPFLKDLDVRFGALPSSNLKNAEGKTYLIPWVGLTAAWSNHPPQSSDAFVEDEGTIVRDIQGVKSIRMVGTNCAFCHSGALDYKGKTYKIDGSPSMLNVRGFFQDLAKSTASILASEEQMVLFLKRLNVPEPEKRAKELNDYFYARLADDTYGLFNAGNLSAKITLAKAKYFKDTKRFFRGQKAIADTLEKLVRVTYGLKETDNIGDLKLRMKYLGNLMVGTDPKLGETTSGYNRTDAFGRIGNLVLRGDDPIDYTAPVSLPWVWGLKYMAMLHYNANSNSVILRNVGQSLGLGAIITNKNGDSTVNIHNLDRIEHLVHKIQVPDWNTIFAGVTELQINQELAQRGQKVYERNCQGCHESNHFVGPNRQLREYHVIRLEKIGTDPNAAVNATKAVGHVAFEDSIFQGVGGLKARYYQKYDIREQQQAEMEFRNIRGYEFFRDTLNGFDRQNSFQNNYGDVEKGAGYKARHLSGAWGTAPFLHNGSVPNMWELLQPHEKRSKIFEVRSREFDPKVLGYKFEREKTLLGGPKPCKKGEDHCFDTSAPGNSNKGHYYGTSLADSDKWALIEYLKVLPPEPEYSW